VVTSTFILGGMLLGLSRKAATDFSFYLAIPGLIDAGVYRLHKERALLSVAEKNAVIQPEFRYFFSCRFGARLKQAAHASRLPAGALPAIEASGHRGPTGGLSPHV
jgi:hypothetical protein